MAFQAQLRPCFENTLFPASFFALQCKASYKTMEMVKRNWRDHTQSQHSTLCHSGQLHGCYIVGSYKHWISPVADLDGYLDSHQDIYISPSKSEKCSLGGELLPLYRGINCDWVVTVNLLMRKFTYASRSILT